MVEVCRNGQGSISPSRARSGVWNKSATPEYLEDQHKINTLLKCLRSDQRIVIADMLQEAFSNGVFETLKALEEFEVQPFMDGYEGSPYADFTGRIADDPWQWPENSK